MAETERWTVGRLLQWTAQYLKQHGSESPRLEAEVLLADGLARNPESWRLCFEYGFFTFLDSARRAFCHTAEGRTGRTDEWGLRARRLSAENMPLV